MAVTDTNTQPGQAAEQVNAPAVDNTTVVADTAIPAQEPADAEKPKIDIDAIDEDTQLRLINKALGSNYKTLDEAKPKAVRSPEDIAAEKEAKKQKALEWALGTGKTKKDEYERAIIERSKNTRDIAMALFAEQERAENPKISEEEIAAQFSDEYHEDLDIDSPLRKRALARMDKVAKSYLAEITGPIDNIEAEYDNYISDTEKYTGYQKQIKNVASALPKELVVSIPYTGADGTETTLEYKVPVEDNVMTAVRKEFLDANTYLAISGSGREIKDADIANEMTAAIENRILRKAIPKMLADHGEKVAKDFEAHLKAIPNTGNNLGFGNTARPGEAKKPPEYTALRAHQKY